MRVALVRDRESPRPPRIASLGRPRYLRGAGRSRGDRRGYERETAPRRPPVPDRLAAWQSADELAASIASAGLREMLVPVGNGDTQWRPLEAAMEDRLAGVLTLYGGVPPEAWRLSEWVTRHEGRNTPVYLTLQGRAGGPGEGPPETIAVKVTARRGP